MEEQDVACQPRRSFHTRTAANWRHVERQTEYPLKMGRGVIFPTEIWLQIIDSLSPIDLKYLALVSKFFRSLCIPSLLPNVRLLRRHIEERENPPKWFAGARRLKLRDESFSGLIVDSRLVHYKGISFFGSSLSVLSLVNVRLPRRFYYYLLMIPAIRHLELSTVTVDDSTTLPTLSSLIQSSIYSLNPLPKENGDVPRTIPKHLYKLTLESLRVHNLGIDLLAQVLRATRKDTLLKVCMESPCQDSRIINDMLSLRHITSLTLSWETTEVRFPVMLFPRLQYLDVLHSHVGAFLRRGHRVKTLKLKEFEPSTLERLPMNGLPAPDLGSMLSPSGALNSALEPTFNGIQTLHISIYGINRDWLGRLVSVVTRYPHIKDFCIRADLVDLIGAPNAGDAFQFSIDLLNQYRGGTTGTLERLCFSFKFLDNLEVDCRKKQEAEDCEWDVRRTNARALEEWILVRDKLTNRDTGDVYYPRPVC